MDIAGLIIHGGSQLYFHSVLKSRKKEKCSFTMRLPAKIGIASIVIFMFVIIVGFLAFPRMIKHKVKGMTALKPGNEIRGMFLKVPFPLDFKIYMFNVTNPMDVQAGQIPSVNEIGPFCYQEWKEKVDVADDESDDTILYNPKDTFIATFEPGCLTGDELVTIPHPMILGVVNTVIRQKPGALSLVNKAIKSIYNNPESIFLTAKAKDILFEGVVINCGVKDFPGKAICSQLRAEPSLKQISEDEIGFSILGPKNATAGKRFKAYRGIKDPKNLGRVVEYDGKPEIENWPTEECNKISGTDGTIFPTYLTPEDGLASFSPELCRSLVARYEKMDKYDGIPVSSYYATLGDMSKNPDEGCYCLTPDTCLKKGMMDLYKCSGVPIYASLPHFYDSDESYLKTIKGLHPEEEKHRIKILFERTTGSPLYAKKRLQFNMPVEANDKVDLFKTLPTTILPLFWIEEGVELNITYTKQLKTFFMIQKDFGLFKWVLLSASLCGMGIAGYLHFKSTKSADITPVHKGKPEKSISTVNGSSLNGQNHAGHVNHAMSGNELDKY